MNLEALHDRDLIHETERMAQSERAFTIKLLHHLNEIGRRKLHLDLGYQSLFDYCIRKLKYSSSAAGRRIAAARCIRRFPQTESLLEERELSLCTVAMIEPILNEENAASILQRAHGASRRDVEKVVNEYRPPVALRDRIRPVRVAMNEPVEIDALLFERECAQGVPEAWRRQTRIEALRPVPGGRSAGGKVRTSESAALRSPLRHVVCRCARRARDGVPRSPQSGGAQGASRGERKVQKHPHSHWWE